MWQSDRGKTTWPNTYSQERTKKGDYWYCCTSWCKGREKRLKKWKIPKIWKKRLKDCENWKM